MTEIIPGVFIAILWNIFLSCRPFNEYFERGNKLPVERGFFKNSAGDLLPALRFLGGLYNFCNFIIIFSLL